jgi:hypothetical protein
MRFGIHVGSVVTEGVGELVSNKVGANLRSLVASNKEHWLPDLVFIFESKRNQSSRIHDQLVGTQDQGGI